MLKSDKYYYLFSVLIAFIYSLYKLKINGYFSVGELIMYFIGSFWVGTFIGIPIQIISNNTRWSKILFWSMLFGIFIISFSG